jgi:hypothetical protein
VRVRRRPLSGTAYSGATIAAKLDADLEQNAA